MELLKIKTIRFDVAKSRSRAWPWFVRRAKRCAAHRVSTVDGIEVHTVHISRTTDLQAIRKTIESWKQVDIYLDYGRGFSIVGHDDFQQMLYKYLGQHVELWAAARVMREALGIRSRRNDSGA